MSLPSGPVTLLFTDVEGSTRLLDRLGPDYDSTMETQFGIIKDAVASHGGQAFGCEGDALFAVFVSEHQALCAAEDAQCRLTSQRWPASGTVRVRIAVNTGEVRLVGGTYYGRVLHETARVCGAAHGGQILTTQATLDAELHRNARDMGEHQLRDLPGKLHLYQLLGDGLADSFPPLRTLSTLPNNLPLSSDEFVGRTTELAAITRGLDSHRLVTLTGTGGCGKTRLSLEVASRQLASFHDGVWYVELAPLSDADRIPAQFALSLGVGEATGVELRRTLIDWLRHREVLLIVDNCEHLISEVAELVDEVLRACPRVRILATSREALGVRGERAMRVPPLDLEGEAAQLFVARAEAIVAGFESEALDWNAVDQVCRRLDGLPLAIELAAARLRSLSLTELASRLDDRFRLLTLGNRTAPTRQRTLSAVVDWSYDLLPDVDRELFRAVCVFPDSFALDAAAEISGRSDLDALDGLSRLVEKSLLSHAQARAGLDRFQLLETIRHYGRERLREQDEWVALHERLLAWAMKQVARLEEDMRTPRMDASLAAVMPERVNMRAAMDWALENHDLESALRIVTTVPLGLTSERRGLIAELLQRGGDHLRNDAVARAQLTLADLAFEQSDWPAAASSSAAAQEGFSKLGDRDRAAWAKHVYSSACWGAGDLANLDVALAELLDEFQRNEDDYGIAQAVWRLSLREPDRQIATSLAIEAERRYSVLGSPIMRAHALEARGLIELEADDLDAAAPFLREAVETFAAGGNKGCTAHTLESIAAWAAKRGNRQTAGELVGAAEALRAASGAGHKPWEVRARYGAGFETTVLGSREDNSAAIDRGYQLSLMAAAAMAVEQLSSTADSS